MRRAFPLEKMEKLAYSISIENLSRSQISEMTKGLNEQVEKFRNRSLADTIYPVLRVDALYEKSSCRWQNYQHGDTYRVRCGRKWPQRYYRAYDVINSYAKRFLKTVQCLEDGLEDSLAFYAFPMLDARKISSSNMIERLNREIRRRTSVIGIFPNKSSYVRLVTTYLMEYAEDWSASRVNIQRSCFSSYYCSSTAQLCGKPHSVFCTYRIFMRNIDK